MFDFLKFFGFKLWFCAFPSDLARTKDWGTEILTDADLEGQFDLIINWLMASVDAAAGHDHSAAANKAPKIDLTTSVTRTLPLANGGTGQTTLAALLNLIYPIGSIYTNASVATNPGTLLGFGTWVAFGAGKVMVGLDAGDEDFDTAEETGGAKTIDVEHLHEVSIPHRGWNHMVYAGTDGLGASSGSSDADDAQSAARTLNSENAGSAVQSIVQPYIVVYMWKRTA